jgi:hypothetical protein
MEGARFAAPIDGFPHPPVKLHKIFRPHLFRRF